MRFNHEELGWRYVAHVLEENSRRLSRTRAGVSDTTVSAQKRPLLLSGEALRIKSAENESCVHQLLIQMRQEQAPLDARDVLGMIWAIADLTNKELLPSANRFREWSSVAQTPGSSLKRVDPAELPAALERFAQQAYLRWPELDEDPVPLASWAEWELNGGNLHPFYDGCGRISRAFGALLLLRGSSTLPLYEDRETYFAKGCQGPDVFAAYVRERIDACAVWCGH